MILSLAFTAAAALSSFQGVQVYDFHDGDTFRVQLGNVPEVFGRKISIRIRGIDSPEIRDERACVKRDAEAAKLRLEKFLQAARVDLERCQRDKYFRLVCDVHIFGQKTQDAAAHMLASGLAQPYDGKQKSPWTCIKLKGKQ